MERLREIVLWGDSIMRGVVYDEAKQKYSLASPNGAEAASRVLGIPLRNRARMGCTVDKGLTLIQKDLKTEKEEGEGIEAALLEFGGNDCDFNWGQVAADPGPEAFFRERSYSLSSSCWAASMAARLSRIRGSSYDFLRHIQQEQ